MIKYKWTKSIAAGSKKIMCFPITKIFSLGSVYRKNWTEQSEKQTLLYNTSEKFTYRSIVLVYWVVDVVEIEALNSILKLQKKLVGFSLGFYSYLSVLQRQYLLSHLLVSNIRLNAGQEVDKMSLC